MPLRITYKNLQRGPFQKLLFTIKSDFEDLRNDKFYIPLEEDAHVEYHTVDKKVEVYFQFTHTLRNYNISQSNPVKLLVEIASRVTDERTENFNTIILETTCNELNYSEHITCTDNWIENIKIGTKEVILKPKEFVTFSDLEINLSVIEVLPVTFAKLYDDTILTDFHLCTAEGSIAVHKACLAAHSDVFKTMFNGPWKGVAEGQVGLGITLGSLQHFKDYVYLSKLPDDEENLRPLLLLSSYYFMDNLKTECISKLMGLVKPENLYSLLEFACKNNIPDLSYAMLLQIPDDVVDKSYELKKFKQICAKDEVKDG